MSVVMEEKQPPSKVRDGYASFRQRTLSRACDVSDRSNWFKAIQADQTLSSYAVCLAGIITDRTDGGGVCWAPQALLASASHCTTRQVRRVFSQMVALGWLEILEGNERAAHLMWRGEVQRVDARTYVYRMVCPNEAAFRLRLSWWADA